MIYTKQRQVVAIYLNKYEIVFTDKDDEKVKQFARQHQTRLKKQGAIKVITNTGYYETQQTSGEID